MKAKRKNRKPKRKVSAKLAAMRALKSKVFTGKLGEALVLANRSGLSQRDIQRAVTSEQDRLLDEEWERLHGQRPRRRLTTGRRDPWRASR